MRVRVELAMLDFGKLDELKELFASKPGSCAVAFDLVSSKEPSPRCAPISACRRTKNWSEIFAGCAAKTQ